MTQHISDPYNIDAHQIDDYLTEAPPHKKLDIIDHLFYHNLLIQMVITLSIIGTVAAVLKVYLDSTRTADIKQEAVVNISPTIIPTVIIEPTVTSVMTTFHTFIHNDLQFTFNYPLQYNIVENQSTLLYEADLMQNDVANGGAVMNITVYQMDISPVEGWIQAHSQSGESNSLYFPGVSNIVSGIKNNYSVVGFNDIIPASSNPIRRIVFTRNGYAYVLSSGTFTDNAIFDGIVETFVFLQN